MEKNSSLVEHAAIILPGLIIGYFLLITNPPPDLLQYNENLEMATTYHLSGPEILNHLSSVFIFITLFLLISVFLVFVCSRLFLGKRGTSIDVVLVSGSIGLLGLIALPYYGYPLTAILYVTGFMGMAVAISIFYYPFIPRLFYLPMSIFLVFGFSSYEWIVTDMPFSLVWKLWFSVLSVLMMSSMFLILIYLDYKAAALRKLRKKLKRKRKARKRPST